MFKLNNEYSLMDEINNLTDGLQKLENTEIEQSNAHLKLKPVIFELSWQTYRILAFIFFGLSFAVMKYIVDFFDKKLDDKDILNVLKIVSFFFILNFGTFLFMNVYYKYRKSIKGVKGARGDRGKRGNQGEASFCNICEKKTGGYRREYDSKLQKEIIVQNILIDFDNYELPSWIRLNHKITILGKEYRIMTPSYLGPGKKGESTDVLPPPEIHRSNENKPIIGISASINNITGEIYSIMYLIDSNKYHNPKKYKFKPLHNTPFGIQSKKGVGIEFKALPDTAINKIELFHNGDKILSLRIYCANIMTGEPSKVIDPISNRKANYATIGKKINKFDKTLIREVVESGNFIHNEKMYPTFISEVSAIHDPSNDGGIFSLGFLKSSIFQKDFKLITENS